MSQRWTSAHAKRYSRDAATGYQRRHWAYIANSWRLAGYDDDRCIREACSAVTLTLAEKIEAAGYQGGDIADRRTGPQPITTTRIPSKYRARHALREAADAARKRPPRPPGE